MNTEPDAIRNFRRFEIVLVTFFWVLLFASPLLLGQTANGVDWKHVFKLWKEHSILLSLFLVNRFIFLPYIFFRGKRFLYILVSVFLIIVAVTGMYILDRPGNRAKLPDYSSADQRPANAGRDNASRPGNRRAKQGGQQGTRPEPVPAHVNLFILSVLVLGFDSGLRISSRWLQSEKNRMTLEKENVENQLAFLKNQISPHFFMNTLNNIHSLIDFDTTEAKKSVIKLSNLMRYLLYESEQGFCPLRKEIEFIKSYVDLMRLRYSDSVRIVLNVPQNPDDKLIPPLLFISLLDNAFKHGVSYAKDSFIEIEITTGPEWLHLTILNSKSGSLPSDPGRGIGIENTRRRLDLLYKDAYVLEINDDGNTYSTRLTIPL
ncbi:MAG: histidine kinase [Bacteroidales bacterium]